MSNAWRARTLARAPPWRALRQPGIPFDDLPVGILANDFPVAEFVMVAATHPDFLAPGPSPGQQPFGGNHVSVAPVAGFAVVHIRQAGEAPGQALPHRCPPRESLAPRVRPARHVESAVVGDRKSVV